MNRLQETVWLLVASGVGCTRPNPAFQAQVLQCAVTRQECVAEGVSSTGGLVCAQFSDPVSFTATACADQGAQINDVCRAFYCAQPTGIAYGYPSSCSAVATDITSQIKPDGLCRSTGGGPRLSLVSLTRRWRDCALAPGGASCASLNVNGNSDTLCVDTSSTRAFTSLQPTIGTRDASIHVSSFVLSSPGCPLIGDIKRGSLTYDMTASSIGTAKGGGTSATLGVRSGFAISRQDCSSETCVPAIDNLHLNLSDRRVNGLQVSGVTITNISPIFLFGSPEIDSGLFTLPAGSVSLLATGRVNEVDTALVLENKTPWHAKATAALLTLQGSLDLEVTDAKGHPLPVTVTIDAKGKPASATVQACSRLSPLARLFGFEDPESWRSTDTAELSLVRSPITQGCGALGVEDIGPMPITSTSFTTSGLSPRAALSIDLFIPSGQPNPQQLGALQMSLSCPSGGVNNQRIGTVNLTGKPLNAFSTLRFALPQATLATLGRPLNDCSFAIAFKVNATQANWILDNLRFTP